MTIEEILLQKKDYFEKNDILLPKLFDRLFNLIELGKEEDDTEDPNIDSLLSMLSFIESIAFALKAKSKQIIEPQIMINDEGIFSIEWENGRNSLLLIRFRYNDVLWSDYVIFIPKEDKNRIVVNGKMKNIDLMSFIDLIFENTKLPIWV